MKSYLDMLELRDKVVWPTDISEEFKTSILKRAKVKIGPESLPMVRSPSKPQGLFYVLKGVLSVDISNYETNKDLSLLFSKGDWLFASSMVDDKEVYFDAYEIDELIFLYFSYDSFIELLDKYSTDVYKFLFFSTSKVNATVNQSLSNLIFDKEFRLSYVLLDLYKRINESCELGSESTTINISQSRLSKMTSLSRPKLNLEMKKLENLKVISIGRKKLTIINMSYLKERLSKEILIFHNPVV